MSGITKLEFLSELTELSNQNKRDHGICLFLGAGADVSSGGVLFSDLKKESVSFVRDNPIHEYEDPSLIDKEFNMIMDTLDDNSRCAVIQRLIKKSENWLPSDGYKLLILLAKENCISSVITTNFANLLETTEEIIGVDAFQIFTPATAVPASYFMKSKHHKPIYLKMHGDVDGKLITHLTSDEIESKNYQHEFIQLFQHLIRNETIIFLGYSGWDSKISEIFAENISYIKNVYWCNISEPDINAPLIKTFNDNKVNIKYINYNFDKALQVMATELLKDRTLFHVDSIFIYALLKAKIQKIQSDFFSKINNDTKGITRIKRSKAMIFDDFMLDIERNFCIITGNPGMGKSMLIAELCDKFEYNEDIWMVPLNAMTTYSNDLLDYIIKKLGYASKDPVTVLYQFSSWAYEQKKNFVFVIDNLGNRVGSTKEVAFLINRLIELAYIIRKFSCIKIIITLRTDIWNKIYEFLDSNYLENIIWNEKKESCAAISIDSFDEYELNQAKNNLLYYSKNSYIPNDFVELIKDPSLYGIIEKNVDRLNDINNLNIYTILENTFFQGITKNLLEKLAFSLICDYIKSDMPTFLSPESKNYLRNNEELKNILYIEENTISFKNDIIFECCVASYFFSNRYIDIFLNNINSFIENYIENYLPTPIYKGVIRYLSINCEDFGKVVNLLCIINETPTKNISKFINDTFKYMALYNAKIYSINIRNFNTKIENFKLMLPYFIHSIGFMKDEYALPLLNYLRDTNTNYSLECNVLLNDRFSMKLREIKNEKDLNDYFTDNIKYILIPNKPILSIFLLLWIMGRIGLDNISKKNYKIISSLILQKFKSMEININKNEIEEVKNIFLDNAYFIFFNSDASLELQFNSHEKLYNYEMIYSQVKEKRDLDNEQIKIIKSSIDHFGDTIDFFFYNIIFVYMSTYDIKYAIRNLDKLYQSFNENTKVIELDFFSSILFLSCYINNPIDRNIYLEYYKKMVLDFEMKMFISPSTERASTCRKFEDKFDIEFEDGFNILTDYTYTAPMTIYTSESSKENIDSCLELFWNLLEKLDKNGMYDEIIIILKAINQMSVNWPKEALEALFKFSKFKHPIIRKAIIRILEENYLRYPILTIQFIEHCGEAFSENELLQIYSSTNSQIKNRTLEQLQWARMLFYISKYINKNISDDILNILSSDITLNEVFEKLIQCLMKND